MYPIETPFKTYTDLYGKPLNGGSIYLGLVNQNPITAPVTVYWDAAGTQPAAQPLRTINGYIVRAGTPANVFVVGAYSELVQDLKGQQVFYARNSDDFSIVTAFLSLFSAFSGSSLVGYILNAVGAVARTVEARLRDMAHIKDFGAVCDGVADDAPAWALAAASGKRTIDARGMTMAILTQVNLASNQTLLLAGARIFTGGTALKTFSAVTKTRFNLVGPFEIVGDLTVDPGTAVTSAGVYIEDCSKWRVSDLTALDIKGAGLWLTPGASTTARSDHGVVANLRADNCVWGWKDVDGTGSEYCTAINAHVTRCYDAGIETSAGNTLFVGGHCVDNRKDGFRINGGPNHAHGSATGMNINHNAQFTVVATQVTNGFDFANCHFYGNGVGVGNIFLDRCKGINFNGGHLACWVYNDKDASSGQNIIRNMFCPGSYGDVVVSSGASPGTDQLWITDCYGPGAYTSGVTINDPSPVYALARRSPATFQSMAAPANLIYPVEIRDRRLAYDNTTGVFTVPVGQAGTYRVSGTAVMTGTAMDVINSYIDLRTSGASYGLFLPAIFGTTKLVFQFDSEFDLLAGDTIALFATINGTTPQFGDGTWVSQLSISRIA